MLSVNQLNTQWPDSEEELTTTLELEGLLLELEGLLDELTTRLELEGLLELIATLELEGLLELRVLLELEGLLELCATLEPAPSHFLTKVQSDHSLSGGQAQVAGVVVASQR